MAAKQYKCERGGQAAQRSAIATALCNTMRAFHFLLRFHTNSATVLSAGPRTKQVGTMHGSKGTQTHKLRMAGRRRPQVHMRL